MVPLHGQNDFMVINYCHMKNVIICQFSTPTHLNHHQVVDCGSISIIYLKGMFQTFYHLFMHKP
jgi:hypothetical protein